MFYVCFSQIFNGINGLLLPGGDAPLTGAGGYATVGELKQQESQRGIIGFIVLTLKTILGELFYDWAKEANDKGDFFPIWGTCNGYKMEDSMICSMLL